MKTRTIFFLLFVGVSWGLTACGGGQNTTSLVADNGGAPSAGARTAPLPPEDPDCPNGGILVETGIDENRNGLLDDEEVDETSKVCHGLDGRDGADGQDGRDGADGRDGNDGLNALVKMTPEPAGDNCPYKGIRIDSGQDTNGNGTLEAAEITDTGYVCNLIDGQIGWQAATLVELNEIASADSPVIAMDAQGNAMAVWRMFEGGIGNLRASYRIPGVGWGDAVLLESRDDGHAVSPRVAMNPSGEVLVVWIQTDGIANSVWAKRFTPDGGWEPEELIETQAGEAKAPDIAMDSKGNAIVVWQQNNAGRWEIWANHYRPKASFGWGSARRLDKGSGDATRPRIAMDGEGNAMVVWQQPNNGTPDIMARRYEAGASSWGEISFVENETLEESSRPQVAMDDAGNAIAVWFHWDGWNVRPWANRYTPGDGWGTAADIGPDEGRIINQIRVAMNAAGEAMVVWGHEVDSRSDIWANRYSPDSGWGKPQRIETNAGGAGYAQVVVDAAGNALVVWRQTDGWQQSIWANRYLAGRGWGQAELLENSHQGEANHPQIAMDAAGNAIAVWIQSDGSRNHIWANRWIAP